ncbi:hypothetical protein HRbin06_00551 [archaeon HR06]|nr:hypothetical protein HRbin06_00551 [archaeon HR06]
MLKEDQAKKLLELIKEQTISYILKGEVLESFDFEDLKVEGLFINFKLRDKALGTLGSIFPQENVTRVALDLALALTIRLKAKGVRIDPYNLSFEITEVLNMELISSKNPLNLLKKIEGYGVFVERGFYKGVILPNIAIERGLTPLDMLAEACISAGLLADFWTYEDTKIYRFKTITYGLSFEGNFYKI